MKKIGVLLLMVMLFLASCGNSVKPIVDSKDSASLSTVVESSQIIEKASDVEDIADAAINASSQAKVYNADVDLDAIGGAGIYWEYSFKYMSIPADLIMYIGEDLVDAWIADVNEEFNLQTCIEHFGLTVDEVLEALNPPEIADYAEILTISDVEILCSGNQAAINQNFASSYAAVSEDGDIYTIFWLAEHDETDYIEAGLTAEEVGKAVEACADLGIVDTYVASVQTSLVALEENIAE